MLIELKLNQAKQNIAKSKENKMYYTSNQTSNDYYSSYKENMQEYPENNSVKKIIKVGLIILFFALLSVAAVYLVNYFSTEARDPLFGAKTTTNYVPIETTLLEEEKNLNKIELTGEELPKSIQLQESTSQDIVQIQLNATDTLNKNNRIDKTTEDAIINKIANITKSTNINPKDIALIVEIIMAQMNNSSEPTLETQLINAKKQKMVKHDLKDINHYNKVVIGSDIEQKNSSELMKLRNNLNTMMKDSKQNNIASDYSKAIEKEISIRSNEMKIIIVQKGDTLSKIAEKAYGNRNAYRKIFIANPEVLKNPNEIFIGQKLRIPS